QQPISSQVCNNTTVVMTQPSVVTTAVIPYVNDNMGLSIFSCLCCCWIIGIFAIMKSSEARNLYVAGDYNGAMMAAQTARNLSIAAIVCGISGATIYFIIQMIVISSS
uniref:CD225/dispanin family protein n=1 Tax=Salmonella sp. s54925 TaxID=3159674 RepID=UPI00397E9E1C